MLVAYRSFSMISWRLNVSIKDRQQAALGKSMWVRAQKPASLRDRQNFSSVASIPESEKTRTQKSQSFPSVTFGEELHTGKPLSVWHSVKSSAQQRPSSPSATLEEEQHSTKKNVTWRSIPPTPLKLYKKTSQVPFQVSFFGIFCYFLFHWIFAYFKFEL